MSAIKCPNCQSENVVMANDTTGLCKDCLNKFTLNSKKCPHCGSNDLVWASNDVALCKSCFEKIDFSKEEKKEITSIKCNECGSTDVTEIKKNHYHCNHCDTEFKIKADTVHNTVNVTNVYSVDTIDTKNYICEHMITEKDFITSFVKKAINNLIPIEFFSDAKFEPVQKHYEKLSYLTSNVTVSYSGQIATPHEVQYQEKNSNGEIVLKTKTEYSYSPVSGQSSFTESNLGDYNSSHSTTYDILENAKEYDQASVDCEIIEDNIEESRNRARDLNESAGYSHCSSQVYGSVRYNQRLEGFRASTVSEDVREYLIAVPYYSMKFEYNNEEYEISMIAHSNSGIEGQVPVIDSYDKTEQTKLESEIKAAQSELDKAKSFHVHKLLFTLTIAMLLVSFYLFKKNLPIAIPDTTFVPLKVIMNYLLP